MNEIGLLIIKTVCSILAGLFLVLGSLFAFWGQWQQGKHEKMREWFRKKWSIIACSRWLTMPERVIRWVLDTRAYIGKKILNWRAKMLYVGPLFMFGGMALLTCVAFWIQWTFVGGIISAIVVVPFLIVLLDAVFNGGGHGKLFGLIESILEFEPVLVIYLVCLSAVASAAAGIWLVWLLRLDIVYATLAMIVLSPVYWVFFFLSVSTVLALLLTVYDEFPENIWYILMVFSVVISASFSITLLALLLGHTVYPALWVPQTVQMLISNVVCDGFTLVATFWILGWSVAKKGLFRIPQAILLDIFVAALLACCSLYFGLVFTEHGLSPGEVLRVLIGKSPEGSGLEFGPYFWAMHTTFIPTVLYLLLIGVCWMAKVMLTVAGKFTKRALQHEKPCELTAALFGILFALFTALSLTFGSAEDWAEKHKQIEPPVKKVVEPNQVDND